VNLKRLYKQLPTGIHILKRGIKTQIYEGDILDFGCWKDGEGERAVVYYAREKAAYKLLFYSKHGGEGCEYLNIITHISFHYKGKMSIIGSIYHKNAIKKCGVTIKCD
jgi:hypothetical protein